MLASPAGPYHRVRRAIAAYMRHPYRNAPHWEHLVTGIATGTFQYCLSCSAAQIRLSLMLVAAGSWPLARSRQQPSGNSRHPVAARLQLHMLCITTEIQ